MFQECLVELCYLLAGGTIDEYRIEDVHLHNLVTHVFRIGSKTGTQDFLVVIQVDAVAVQHEIVNIRYADNIQFQAARLHQELLLGANLFEQHTAHRTDSADEDVEHLVF